MSFQVIEIQKFFELGWDLISKGGPETGQYLIKKLATEEGLAMINTLVAETVHEIGSEKRLSTFDNKILPFFRTITYPDVLASLILETPLDTICTFLFGPNGRRAIHLFKFVTSALIALARDEKIKDEDHVSTALIASLAVLERIVDLNQSAQVVMELTPIVSELSSIPENLLDAGSRSLARVRQRLGLGAAMSLSGGRLPEQKSYRPTFEIGQDFPGVLSELGPRHDNDHANISDIQILPTSEEIQSPRLEYLPSSDPMKHHLPGLAGLLDRQFRLLREDTVGQLRDAVQQEIKRLNSSSNAQTRHKGEKTGVRSIIYHKVTLLGLEFDRKKGLQFVAEFDQPLTLAKMSAREREAWWQSVKQLRIGAFVCLVSSTGRAIFFSVCDLPPTPRSTKHWEEQRKVQPTGYYTYSGEAPSLYKHAGRASLMLSLVNENAKDITWINSHLGKSDKLRKSLVEFPGILLPSFGPTLQALQQMSRTLDLPFSQFIAPDIQHGEDVDVPPPAYSRRPGFTFNLETLAGGERLTFTPGQPFDETTLRDLDHAQQISTVSALRSSFALIQGPPGTGKSYTGVAIIKALLKNRNSAKMGPIICVCYTNHALDQLLEHLVEDGVEQLIRIGSRSKSVVIQDLNLHDLSQKIRPTKTEGQENYQLYSRLENILDEIEQLMPVLQDPAHWSSIKEYLQRHHDDHFEQLFGRGVDEQGFQEVRGKKFHVLKSWIRGAPKSLVSNRPVSGLLNVKLQGMSGLERSSLHQYWVQQCIVEVNQRFLHILDSYRDTKKSLNKCYQEKNLRCLLQAHVIGATTTGLARHLDILRRVRAKVVVFEEAGEVLEAHTLTALLPSVEHAILIGDHEQLRPQINNYEFQYDNPRGAQFSLDVSLFERLIHPRPGYVKLPHSSLEVQRRMHPSIAELVRSTLYPKLQDHSSVFNYPEVVGIRKRLFWLDHSEKEDASSSDPTQSFSRTNAWEVEMTAALVSHLVRQGTYQNGDIAVLTPYLGQLQKLKQRLRSSFAIVVGDRDLEELETKGLENKNGENPVLSKSNARKTTLLNALRIATVDNFQGEEAKVIVISLVRSNEERRCGFLKTSNRINVLLSRAKHGMYIIGSTATARSVLMWDTVIKTLEKGDNVGQTLALCCPRHMETSIEVSKPDDFSIFSPEGGCNRRCDLRLGCGHACINKCHSDALHDAVRCLERCQRTIKGCDHACPKVCGDPCNPKCQTRMPNITLPCGHVQAWLACHWVQAPTTFHCPIPVETEIPGCKHRVKVRCHELPLATDFPCNSPCSAALSCGHHCKQKCKDCSIKNKDGSVSDVNHGICKTACGRQYNTCSHVCSKPCHGKKECPPCLNACEARCSHSKCTKKCHEPCIPCVENCSWSCPHRGACKLPCAVPCDLLPCSKRCPLMLSCGHQCPSLCGELCPESTYCQVCAAKTVKDTMVDYILGSTYGEIDLDENPCIIPSCGHILALESMDGHMEMSKHYIISEDPEADQPITALKTSSVPFSASDMRNCPMCRGPLRNINRYGRIVRRAWIDEATKKFIVRAEEQFVVLASRMEQAEAKLREPEKQDTFRLTSALNKLSIEPVKLTGSRDELINVILKQLESNARYTVIFSLRRDIRRHLVQVDEAEQPISHIYDLVQDARRTRGVVTELIDLPSVLQVRNRLLATVLYLRCDYAILLEFVNRGAGTASEKRPRDIHIDLGLGRMDCETLIEDAASRHQPQQAVEGLLYWARFVALERERSAKLSDADMTDLVKRASEQLVLARQLCNTYPGQTAGMPAEVSEAEKSLRASTFYAPVTNAEKQAVYAAMAGSLRGTGHWYHCVNGHPFTVGECGMPMETARCPQCGAVVGGTNHVAAAGVTQATDMEAFGRSGR